MLSSKSRSGSLGKHKMPRVHESLEFDGNKIQIMCHCTGRKKITLEPPPPKRRSHPLAHGSFKMLAFQTLLSSTEISNRLYLWWVVIFF